VRGVVFNSDGIPMTGVTLTAVGSTDSKVSGADGTFDMMVSPYTKFIEASKEGFISAQAEVDGSYLVFKLQVDKKYAENKAKAEEEARKAAEAEKARLAAEAEAARLAAEKAEQERKAAEAKAKAEEEKRIAAEKAAAEKAEKERLAAEAKAKAEEEKRIAAEKAAAEKAEAAKRAAEEKARIAEEKRIAAEKAAAEKAEQARLAAEAKAKAEEEKRLAAEKAAAEKAEKARLAEQNTSVVATKDMSAEKQALLQAKLEAKQKADEEARIKKEAELAKKQAIKAEREKRTAKWKEASLKGYRSYVDASWAIDAYSLMMSGGLHYIGGYQANNCIFFGIGTGINLAQTYEWDRQEQQLSPNSWNVPVYAYLRTNFINHRCSPFFALSAGYQFSTRREFAMPFDQPGQFEQRVKYKTNSIFVNPQLGVNFRVNTKHSIYIAAGATLFQRPEIIEVTPMTATFGSGLGWGIDLHLGFTF
jgi:chemotaxis protein histidine kinase CheA